ncbi:MAG: hypothetical protein V3T33_07460 [Myxococcota bacterium]
MKSGARLLPNFGAEEGPDWRQRLRHPTVAAAARLWRCMFGPSSLLLESDLPEPSWPERLGSPPDRPVFTWLEDSGGFVPWLWTAEAAAASGMPDESLVAAVREVHDKAFAHCVARRRELLPRELAELITVVEPENLRASEDALRWLEVQLDRWPGWAKRRFVLKPRWGSSGRGCVQGRSGRLDSDEIRGALPRLAERGGALLEPWLERTSDLSAQLHLDRGGAIRMLGTLELVVSPAGLYLGHRGGIDSKGRVYSESVHDEALREAAADAADSARERGFHGPCGVDAFAYRDENQCTVLRPIVEFNARFTMGTIVIGLLRRALPTLRQVLGLEPGTRSFFYFGLDAPRQPWEDVLATAGSGAWLVPLWRNGERVRPAFLFAPNHAALDPVVARARSKSFRPS